jgi:uncharacterized protein (DUF1684 family)
MPVPAGAFPPVRSRRCVPAPSGPEDILPFMHELLELAEWRRLVAAMYLSEPVEGVEGWERFRRARERLFAEHPQSPLTDAQRALGTGLPYFPYDPAFRVRARFAPPGGEDRELAIDTGGEDGTLRYRRAARLLTPLGDLTLFWLLGYGGGLFLPFRDGTSGEETYGGGRYLTDTSKGTFGRGLTLLGDLGVDQVDGGEAVLDFNYAYNPSCAYNASWACPLAPPENRIATRITAGERAYPNPV